jgi:hypothetical protein
MLPRPHCQSMAPAPRAAAPLAASPDAPGASLCAISRWSPSEKYKAPIRRRPRPGLLLKVPDPPPYDRPVNGKGPSDA